MSRHLHVLIAVTLLRSSVAFTSPIGWVQNSSRIGHSAKLVNLYPGFLVSAHDGSSQVCRKMSDQSGDDTCAPPKEIYHARNQAKVTAIDFLRLGQTFACTLVATAAILYSGVFMFPSNHNVVPTQVDYKVTTDASFQIPFIMTPSAMAAEVPQDQSSYKRNLIPQHTTVLDEVWTLVNKYYLDQSFNNHDWNKIRSYYEDRLPLVQSVPGGDFTYDDDTAMKLATSMVSSLGDKYSRMLSKESYARIQKFDLIGVGATLIPEPVYDDDAIKDSNGENRASSTMDRNSEQPFGKKRTIMVGGPPVPGSAADKAGIKMGDYISAVNGVPTAGRTAFDIIDQITEDPNAKTVTMTVVSRQMNAERTGYNTFQRDVTLQREFAKLKNPVTYQISERRQDGTVVGYIRVSEFNSLVKPKMQEALQSLEKQGVNAYVLDLRSNGGGAFQSAVEISGLFLDNALATRVVDANKVEIPFRTPRHNVVVNPNHPIEIWLDEGSASATEVLAGALKDQCRAVIAGPSHSFGKGLIQAVYGLKNGSGLVLTVAKYTTPLGHEIQGVGITPDIKVQPPIFQVPGLTYTSGVDFSDVASRLKYPFCVAPQD